MRWQILNTFARLWVVTVMTAGVCAAFIAAADGLAVVGIFKDKAVITINGQHKTLRVGDTAVAGVRVTQIDNDMVTMVVNGETRRLRMGDNVSFKTRYQDSASAEVLIPRSNNGMYHASGAINGNAVQFLVDTGATVVAINAAQARRLGIDVRARGTPIIVATASGKARAHQVNLDRISVGGIELHNVAAAVVDGTSPEVPLLGMSFLGQIEVQHQGELMRLRKKW